jgi:tetratricopeptide (TPR) repeat protein
MISKELIEIFNRAAGLAREKKFEESLAEYDKIINPSKDVIKKRENQKVAMTGEFLGVAMMRKAWILMDMKRYKEAKEIFEDKVMEACLGQFDLETLYDYFFSYGNTLGDLGNIKGMDDKLSRALGIASTELGDRERCFTCWSSLLSLALRAEDWEYLEKESVAARTFAENSGDTVLRVKADWHHVLAMHGLGKDLEASEEGGVLLTFLTQLGADGAAKDVEELLTEIRESTGKEEKKEKQKTKKNEKGKGTKARKKS